MPIKATDGDRPTSPADRIFEALREAIVHGSLAEGEPVREGDVARMFGAGRKPAIVAMARLEARGLIVTRRDGGVVVAMRSLEDIEEIFEFRARHEPEVIRLAVAGMSPEALRDARAAAEAFDVETDPLRRSEVNRAFHAALYRDCRRPYHLRVVQDATDLIEPYQRLQLTLAGATEAARDEHRAILQACVDGDADRAADLTRRHILGASLSLIDFLGRMRAEEEG